MPLPLPTLCRQTAAAAALLVGGVAHAELLKVSPFLPPQGSANAPTANAPLEFRATVDIDGDEKYRIVDPQHKVGTWLKVGEKDANLDIVLKQADDDHDTVTIEHGGQTMTLQLKAAKVIAGGPVPQMMPPPSAIGGPNVLPQVISSVTASPTQATEQQRLEAVAAEVARRRALREQAAQQAQGGMAPQPMPANVTRQDLQQQPQPVQGRRLRQ